MVQGSEKLTIQSEDYLLPGEGFRSPDLTQAKRASDEELNSRYAKGDIRIVTESARYSLAGILSMLNEVVLVEGGGAKTEEKRYKLDPEYQRRHRWNNARKSRLIESFLMNIPVPPVFLYERDLARFEVMDGRQRLTALAEFYGDKFSLQGLEYWPELEGRIYSNLPSRVRDGIDRRYISSIILLKETADSESQASFLKKIVFERLNSGGVKLSHQETRNAVYSGPLNQLCIDLSSNEKFRRMWRLPNPSEVDESSEDGETIPVDVDGETIIPTTTLLGIRMYREMEDVELILRFFAFRHIQSSKFGLNRISEFLDKFLEEGNKFSSTILKKYREMFEETIDFVHDTVGPDAFAHTPPGKHAIRPTKIVYDAMMFTANLPEIEKVRTRLAVKGEVLRSEINIMYKEQIENGIKPFSGRRTNAADIANRNEAMLSAFRSAITKI